MYTDHCSLNAAHQGSFNGHYSYFCPTFESQLKTSLTSSTFPVILPLVLVSFCPPSDHLHRWSSLNHPSSDHSPVTRTFRTIFTVFHRRHRRKYGSWKQQNNRARIHREQARSVSINGGRRILLLPQTIDAKPGRNSSGGKGRNHYFNAYKITRRRSIYDLKEEPNR